MSKISRIEVTFALPVQLTEQEMRDISRIANNAARRSQTPETVHWAAGHGSKPLWREPLEPGWDDSVYYVECFARERYETEPFVPFIDLRTRLLEEARLLGRKNGGNIDEFDMLQGIERILLNSEQAV